MRSRLLGNDRLVDSKPEEDASASDGGEVCDGLNEFKSAATKARSPEVFAACYNPQDGDDQARKTIHTRSWTST